MNNTILLVEDNEDDAFFMQRAMRDAQIENRLIHVQDGRQAMDYLAGSGSYADRSRFPLPSIIFLDLMLPFKSGFEVLEWLRKEPGLDKLVVIVLTSSSEPVDLRRAYQAGANSYVTKPPTLEQLSEMATAFKQWWLKINLVDASEP